MFGKDPLQSWLRDEMNLPATETIVVTFTDEARNDPRLTIEQLKALGFQTISVMSGLGMCIGEVPSANLGETLIRMREVPGVLDAGKDSPMSITH